MTMAYSHLDRPLADPIRDNADHAGGHHWQPSDFKREQQPDPEHLDRRGLMEHQVDGDHYLGRRFQVWDVVAEYDLDFFEGNCLKYLLRRKPGTDRATDLKKAMHYLEKCLERVEETQ